MEWQAAIRYAWCHMSSSAKNDVFSNQSILLGFLLTIFALLTFFWNYTNPPYLYWDENYHVASAQKYLNGVYFMEPHPPLGKMLVAAGEALIDANEDDSQFIGTDYAKELPGDFSFKGYRFFPVLLGWLIAPLFYVIFLLITRKPLWAFFLSFLYVFDNALVTHSRAAMLDSTMLFFCVSMIALYFLLKEHKDNTNSFCFYSLLFGAAFAGAMTTKALGLIMILLVPALLLIFRTDSKNMFALQLPTFDWTKVGQFLSLSIGAFLVLYVVIWQIHFSIGKTVIDSLPDQGYYQASDEYKALIDSGKTNFPIMLRDSLKFLSHYSEGVPTLNLCKMDENGSPFFFWPLGARSINYRWETPNGSYYKYITLQANPAVWWTVLGGLLIAFAMLVGSFIIPEAKLKYKNELLLWFGFWLSYMVAVSQIERVMYLYHYFLPLLFSFIIFAYVVMEITQIGLFKLTEQRKNWLLLTLGVLIFAAFQFYRPLTYYEAIDDNSFRKRMIFPLWDLHCVNCEDNGVVATPIPMGS